MGLFGGLFKKLGQIVSGQKIDDEFFDELEEQLILADMGVETAMELVENLRRDARKLGLDSGDAALEHLKGQMSGMLAEGDHQLKLEREGLSVILFLGVNGVGKTTTIGKLASRFKQEGRRVLVAAADTFRAAAAEQLSVWAERAGVPIIKHGEGADPAAVVFDAIASFKAKGCDLLLCDTAGRLHNKKNLMSELEKIRRVIARELPGMHTEVLLVLDATTGQNAIAQARVFGESAGLTGVVLTKLDGTAKGGMTVAIKQELGLPVRFVGVGEGIDDLQPFDADAFARALIGA